MGNRDFTDSLGRIHSREYGRVICKTFFGVIWARILLLLLYHILDKSLVWSLLRVVGDSLRHSASSALPSGLMGMKGR